MAYICSLFRICSEGVRESSSCALGELLELLGTIIETTEMGLVSGIWRQRLRDIAADEIKASNLSFVASETKD